MNLDWDGLAARGLRRYVELVAQAIGLGAESSLVQLEEPVCAYLALDRCLAGWPDNDLALVWDERQGWSLALEAPGGLRLTPLGYLDAGLLPAPVAVAGYVAAACAGDGFGRPAPVRVEVPDLAHRLAQYNEPVCHVLRLTADPFGSRRPAAT